MTLIEKIDLLNEVLADLKYKSALALTVQGLYTEASDIKLKDIPDLISKIRVYDFNYKFDFKALNSVGTLKVRNEGTSGGNMGISPLPLDLHVPSRISMKVATEIKYPEKGVFGRDSVISGIRCIAPTISFNKLDFSNISTEPTTFVALPEEETE